MADLDRFDGQLRAAVKGFADLARTEVDAVAVASRAARGRRTGPAGWLERTVPVPIALLLVVGLIALLAVSLAVGGWLPSHSTVLPEGLAGPTPQALAPSPSPAEDLGHVTGSETIVGTTPSTSTLVGGATQLRGGVESVAARSNDPRASGTATFSFSADLSGDIGIEWGTYRLETAGGAWEGLCSGSAWDGGSSANGGCWLVGSGAFAGYTYHRSYSWTRGSGWVEGIIYPGSPPVS